MMLESRREMWAIKGRELTALPNFHVGQYGDLGPNMTPRYEGWIEFEADNYLDILLADEVLIVIPDWQIYYNMTCIQFGNQVQFIPSSTGDAVTFEIGFNVIKYLAVSDQEMERNVRLREFVKRTIERA